MKKFLPREYLKNAKLCLDNNPENIFKGCKYLFEEHMKWRKKFKFECKSYTSLDSLKLE